MGNLGFEFHTGLPIEYFPGLTSGIKHSILGPAKLEIYEAGFDPVDSSAAAFRLAGMILGEVLQRGLSDREVLDSRIRQILAEFY